jgi:hypothetical protein
LDDSKRDIAQPQTSANSRKMLPAKQFRELAGAQR